MEAYYCTLCPRNCGARRSLTEGKGYCRLGLLPRVARIAPHYWEEPCISGEHGSGTIFFSGCVLSCVYCQNYQISKECYGKTMSVEELRRAVKNLEDQGVHNINLVSPTPYIESIIELFSSYRPKIPVVYNTGGYEKRETLQRLEGIVDIYLPDLKYIEPEKSKKYSNAEDYAAYAIPAIEEMVRQTGSPTFDQNGMLKRGTVVRHLILPGNTKNSIHVLDTLKAAFGKDILVSLMAQYIPMGKATDYSEINRRITVREYHKVLDHFEKLELEGYVQELASAKESYVPDWNMSDEGL